MNTPKEKKRNTKLARQNINGTRQGGIRSGNFGVSTGPVTHIDYPPGIPHTGVDPFAPKPIRIYGGKK